jgi:hypothetical protein
MTRAIVRFVLAALILAWSVSSASAQDVPPAPELKPGQVFAWDYSVADLTSYQVVRFERRLDGTGSWTSVGLPTGEPSTDGLRKTFRSSPPAIVSGNHTIEFRACNASICGSPLAMAFIAKLEPVPVFNLRIEPVPPPQQ